MVTTSWSENSPLQGIKFPRGVENGLNNLGWETWVYELGPLRGQAHSFHSSGWGWNLETPAWDRRSLLTRVGNRNSIPIPESDTCCQIKILIPPIDSYVLFFPLHLWGQMWPSDLQFFLTRNAFNKMRNRCIFWCLLLCCGPPGCKLLAETTTSLGITGGFGTPVCKRTWPQTTLVIYVGDHLYVVWVDEHMVAPEIY